MEEKIMSKHGNYVDSKVVCPYYKWSDSNKIACEGIEKGSAINITFGSKIKKKEHMLIYCCDINKYKQCTICSMLNRKYGIKDGT